MNITVDNKEINTELLQVPTMNYGQMQRWEGFAVLRYSIEIEKELFLKKISAFFAEFRSAEIEEDDTFDFPELIAFKNAGWPELNELVQENHTLLKDLIVYHQYEILHLIIKHPENNNDYYYSANSIDAVLFKQDKIQLNGICFKYNASSTI